MARKLRQPLQDSDTLRVLTDLHSFVNPSEIEVTADFSVPEFDGELYLICTNSGTITITHTNKPKDKSRLIVIRSNTGAVSVSGNGNNINGASSLTISAQYNAPIIQYFETLGAHILVGQ
jgi:hypothetical protein